MGKLVVVDSPEGQQAIDTDKVIVPDGQGGVIIRAATALEDDDKPDRAGADEHDANLALYMEETQLNALCEDLVLAIEADRDEANGRRADILKAITILGIKVEEPQSATAVEGQHTVRSPLLLEAVLNFQANAGAELLPTAGPCKIRNDDVDGASSETLFDANALENDFNYFLTVTASEYYPDTMRMLFDHVGLAGAGFKKVYHCPLRRRPSSESVASENLIVNSGATDLKNADRITERKTLSQTRMKFLQHAKFYRDVPLTTPTAKTDELDSAKKLTQGLAPGPTLPASFEHRAYECYCYRDLEGFEHKDSSGKKTGLPLPYRVSIEIDSRKVLEVRRDWERKAEPVEGAQPEEVDDLDEEDEEELTPQRRQTFVKYPFIEALGFYGIGLMHILGNTSTAMTAAWRILLDAGMFSCFPGGVFSKDMIRGQEKMSLRVGPGQFEGINTGGRPVTDAFSPMPYKEPSVGLIELSKLVSEAARRVGNIPEVAVGEGRQDAPVGTTIALLEQATKMMAAVHKGLCGAQAEELQLLKQRFREDPGAFWRHNNKPATKWTKERLIKALNNADLVPAADPNTPSHMHRVMRAIGLVQLYTAFPEMFGAQGAMEVASTVLDVLGWNAEAFLHPDAPSTDQPAVPTDPNAMAAIEQKAKSDAEKNQTDLKKTQMQETTKRAGIQSKEKQEKIKALAGHLKEMAQIRAKAHEAGMKALGLGTRVI